jgi:hypothetical protein
LSQHSDDGATPAVLEGVQLLWRAAVNDEVDLGDVEAARRDVGRDEAAHLAAAERSQRRLANRLRQRQTGVQRESATRRHNSHAV